MMLAAHLWNDLEPDVDGDQVQAAGNGLADSGLIAIVEPEGQQSQRVLERLFGRERDGSQETLNSGNDVGRKVSCGETSLRDLELSDDLEVGQGPRVPGSIPIWAELGRNLVVVDEFRRVGLRISARTSESRTHNFIRLAEARLPFTELDVALGQQIGVLAVNFGVGDLQPALLVAKSDVVAEIGGKVAQVLDSTHSLANVVLLESLGPTETKERKDD